MEDNKLKLIIRELTDHSPVFAIMSVVLLFAAIAATPFVVAAMFNVTAWAPFTGIAFYYLVSKVFQWAVAYRYMLIILTKMGKK